MKKINIKLIQCIVLVLIIGILSFWKIHQCQPEPQKNITQETQGTLTEREAFSMFVTSPIYTDWITKLKINRPENIPNLYAHGLFEQEGMSVYKFELRENTGILNTMYGIYYIDPKTGNITDVF